MHAGNAALLTGAAEVLGNWVGGAVTVGPSGILFTMSALDSLFQLQTAPLRINAEDIHSAEYGVLFRVFRTVDVQSSRGLFRFWALSADELHNAVMETRRKKAAAAEPNSQSSLHR